jgi:hypothetical protein
MHKEDQSYFRRGEKQAMKTKSKAFDRNRRFGVEIEVEFDNGSDRSRAMDRLHDEFRCQGRGADYVRTERNATYWHLKHDGSLGDYGLELASPALKGTRGKAELEAICSVLQQEQAYIDKKCGIHVHHDCTDLSDAAFIKIWQFYRKHQRAIDHYVSPSRRIFESSHPFNGPLSYSLSFDTYENMKERLINDTPRAVINFRSYVMRGTIEFRQHQGSIDAEKIFSWIVFTQGIISWAQWSSEDIMYMKETRDPFLPMVKLGWLDFDIGDHVRSTRTYLMKRIKNFNPEVKFTGLPGGILAELGLPTEEALESEQYDVPSFEVHNGEVIFTQGAQA